MFALAQAACLWACPESPIWLEEQDKERADEACITLWVLSVAPISSAPHNHLA